MKVKTGHEESKIRIEMIALLDVVFLLLVFFIYAMLSMVVQRGIGVSLPNAEGVIQEESIIIVIDKTNRIMLNERVFDIESVVQESVYLSTINNLPVLIRGDSQADLGVAIELLSRLRNRGIESVSFQVEAIK